MYDFGKYIFFQGYRVPLGRPGCSQPPPGCSCHRIWPRSFREPSRGPKSSPYQFLYLRAPVGGCGLLLPFSWCNFKPPYYLSRKDKTRIFFALFTFRAFFTCLCIGIYNLCAEYYRTRCFKKGGLYFILTL